MNVKQMKERVMSQAGEDIEDLSEFEVSIMEYLNDGYMQLMEKRLAGMDGAIDRVESLTTDQSLPDLPERFHSAVADFATWMMYRNGNAAKQARGQAYLAAFQEAFMRLPSLLDEQAMQENGGRYRLKNLYT